MRILENHKLVWLSKPKTGSTTIRRMLDPYATVESQNERPYYHHSSLKMCLEDMDAAGISRDGYDFVVCERNPFTLIPSLWRYSKVNSQYQKFWQPGYDKSLPLMPFAGFMEDPRTWDWFRNMHRLQRFTRAPEAVPVHVFQIEDPAPMIRFLNARIGAAALPEVLPRDNASRYDPAVLEEIRSVFAQAPVAAQVQEVFGASIEQFGYRNPWG